MSIFPTPISPLFLPGGPFEWINEDVGLVIFFTTVLFIVDRSLVRPFLNPKSRYFALHFVANMISAYAALPDVRRALLDEPLNCFTGQTQTMVANSAVASIHIYHMLAFPLRSEDIFHHVAFVSILCGLAIPFKQVGGSANNLGCFFLSGLPGGIDYLLLVLEKEGVISKRTQKKWCTRINVWLRGPSMSIYGFIAFHAWWSCQSLQFPLPFLFVVGFLHFTNGQYYAQQAVESGAVFFEREKNGKPGLRKDEPHHEE